MLPRTFSSRLPHLLLLFLLLLLAAARGDNVQRVTATFSGKAFTNMVFSPKTLDLYVGDKNRIVQLKSSSLAKISELKTGPVNDHMYCPPNEKSKKCLESCRLLDVTDDECRHRLRDTVVRGMVLDEEHLYVCYNVRLGFCQRLSLADVDKVLSNSSNRVVCADSSSHVTMLLGRAPGSQDGKHALYMGVTKCNSPLSKTHYNDIQTLSTRQLENFELVRRPQADFHWKVAETALDIRGNFKLYFKILFRYSFNYLQPNQGHNAPPTAFTYHLVVQPEDTRANVWQTRLGRLCQEDFDYSSYIELTLRCTDNRQQLDYNVAESAYLGRAGSKLANSLNIGVDDEVLYVAFRSCKANQELRHTGRSAVCVYSMREIQETYFKIMKNCLLEGMMNVGPRHYRQRSECTRLHSAEQRKKVTIGYCYTDRGNSPLTGSLKTESVLKEAVLQFNGAEVTSIRGQAASKAYTVVQLGMSDGQFLQYEISSDRKTRPRRVDALKLGNDPIKRLENSSEPNYVFAMSARQISKIRLYDCARYYTCEQCQAAAQPYCGWCILRSACSALDECSGASNWIPFERGLACPKVERLDPPGYQIHSTEPNVKYLLKMRLANVPFVLLERATLPSSPYQLRCCFSTGDPEALWPSSALSVPASACGANIFAFTQVRAYPRADDYHLYCMTPRIDCLPSIPAGRDHVSVRVSLIVQEREPSDPAKVADLKTVRRRAVMLSSEFFVFDCSHYRSCTACVRSKFECNWCVLKNECSYAQLSSLECEKSGIVSHNKSVECPRFEHRSSVILRAAGQRRSRFRVSVRPELDSARQRFMQYFRCVLHCPAGRTFQTRARKSRSMLLCNFKGLNYNEPLGRQRCKLDIQWQLRQKGQFRSLENVKNVSVELFKCAYLVSSCGECLLDLSPAYKCGWCANNHQCSLAKHCPRTKWQNRTEICKSPAITAIRPLNATMNGEVTVTLRGRNLGRTFKDIEGGVVLRLVGVAEPVLCRALPELYVPGKEIRCRVEWKDWKREARGRFEVKVAREFLSRSAQLFSFLEPRVEKVTPMIGPRAGGTRVCLSGRNLAIGMRRRVLWHFPEDGKERLPCRIVSASNSHICCETSPAPRTGKVILKMEFDGNLVKQSHQSFSYEANPSILKLKRKGLIKSGGLSVKVLGSNLHVAYNVSILLQRGPLNVTGECVCSSPQELNCSSPDLRALFPTRNRRAAPFAPSAITTPETPADPADLGEVSVGFRMDGVPGLQKLYKLTVFKDPVIYRFENNKMVLMLDKENGRRREDTLTIQGRNLAGAISPADVSVRTDTAQCAVVTLRHDQIICLLQQPNADITQQVIVRIGENIKVNVGQLAYQSSQQLSKVVIYVIAAGGFVLLLIIGVCVFCLCHCQNKERSKMKLEMEREIMEMEAKVATECKEAFAELQMAMSEVTHALALASPNGQRSLPFRDYRHFCLQRLFPNQEHCLHPVVMPLEIPRERYENFDIGFKKLSELLKNRTFVLITIRALEAQPTFNVRDRSNFASLLSSALQSKMEYLTDLLKVLLVEFISHYIEKRKERLLFRRSESVVEKLLANWLTFLLYDYLQDRVGEPLYLLTQAILLQISSGPVDALTEKSRYTLSDERLIPESVNCSEERLIVIDPHGVFEEFHNNEADWEQTVKVLDVDTITQVKEKILFAIYRHAAYSSRPHADEVELELAEPINGHPEKAHLNEEPRVMQDIDSTNEKEQRSNRPTFRKLNTLKHYMRKWNFKSGAYVKLTSKATRCDTNSYKGECPSSLVNSTSNLIGTIGDHERFDGPHSLATGTTGTTALSSVGGGTLPHSIGPSASYATFPLSQRTLNDELPTFHLIRPSEDQREDVAGRASKMVSEAQLNRMVFTKKCIQRYIDEFLRTVFAVSQDSSTGSDPVVPLCIKYIFDFLDDQACNHNVTDPEVVHVWKSNCLPLRFWVDVVKNPEFLFDLAKTPGVDSSLSVVAQTLIESCNWQRTQLTKDSPATKLLFAQETGQYRDLVVNYYKDIKSIPAISDQEMNAHLIAHSNRHANDFDVTNSFYNLYIQYICKYVKPISEALEADACARRQHLASLLNEVHYYLGSNKC